LAVKRGKEQETRAENQKRVGEQEAEQQEELGTGGQKGIEESQSEQFDWATDINESISPVPSPSDFCINMPLQPVCTLPAPTDCTPAAYMPTASIAVSPNPNHILTTPCDMAPSPDSVALVSTAPTEPAPVDPAPAALVNLKPGDVAADATHTMSANLAFADPILVDPTPVLPKTKPVHGAPVNTSPDVSVSLPDATISPIAHELHNFSALCSGTQNPWGSIHHHCH